MDDSGDVYNVRLGEGGMMAITILKIISNILFIKWGVMALKTFKPIVRDIHRQELQGFGSSEPARANKNEKSH